VGIRRAVRRNERKNLVLVERHGLTGSEVVRAYYHAVAGLSGTVRSAGEVSDYAIGDIHEVKERLEGYLEVKKTYYPEKENTEKYRGLYQVQKQLVKQNMGPVFDLLEKIRVQN